ncbi:MAG: glycoside hydrolase family 78 protein [bacterium]
MNTQNLAEFSLIIFFYCFLLSFSQSPAFANQQPPGDLRCEFLRDPLGIDILQPRLSWILNTAEQGERQTAYQVMVASSKKKLLANSPDLWNSGKVLSDQSIHIRYAGSPLQSSMTCFWKVQVWDRNGRPSGWSNPAHWTMGLLSADDWKASWIGRDEEDKTIQLTGTNWIWYPEGKPQESAPVAARYFRRQFQLPEQHTLQSAHFYFTGDNQSTLFFNGENILRHDDHRSVLDIDLTKKIRPGSNLIAVEVKNIGEKPNPAGFVGLLTMLFTDGSSMQLQTDSTWKTMNREITGWESIPLNDSEWCSSKVLGPAGMAPWGKLYGLEDRRLPARWLRKEFTSTKILQRATVSISGLGLSELYLNGTKVSNHVLSPALSEYPKRVFYVTHDVTSLIQKGNNAIGVILGNGRYFAPRLRQPTTTTTYGYPKLLLQLRCEYTNGSTMVVMSDKTWKLTTEGPIRANNEYDGEEYDARMELGNWSRSGYDDTQWKIPSVVSAPGGALRAQMINPIRVTGKLKPIAITEPQPGVFIFDMGQNMVGWCRLIVKGQRGTHVKLRHAETLKPDGGLYLDNIRGALVTDCYTLKGEEIEPYEPRFTYHGFRFVEVTGFPGKPTLSAIEGCVVNDDVEQAGEFTTSNAIINRTYNNIVWGVKGNYRSISTDCPQRDERQGWLGDRSAESKGETYLFNIAALYSKWIQDMADAQKENGSVSDVCPAYWPLYNDNVTWPSSTVIIPGTLLDQYADSSLIARHYSSMKLWIDHMSGYIKDGIITRDSYGDWCVPPEDPVLIHSQDPMRKTAPGILATTYFYYDLQLMSRYAGMLGKQDDATHFITLAGELNRALNQQFYKLEKGYYDNGSQTSCVLPLAFGMVPPSERDRVSSHLISKIINETKGHIGTGLVGGQWLCRVLSDIDRPDLVYKFATNTTYPSWGYMAERGATTIWELWNGDSADPAMNSGNHVMLVGDLVIWFYEHLAGIKPDPVQPGFKHLLMHPTVVGDLTHIRASHRSPYGLIASEWRRTKDRFEWKITIPANTTATIGIPTGDVKSVTESRKPIQSLKGIRFLRIERGRALYEIESGKYTFRSTLPVKR